MRLLFLNVTPEMDCCGVLICKNDDVTMEMIQEKIDDLKIAAEEAKMMFIFKKQEKNYDQSKVSNN